MGIVIGGEYQFLHPGSKAPGQKQTEPGKNKWVFVRRSFHKKTSLQKKRRRIWDNSCDHPFYYFTQ
jgi:hypothetical protein